MGAFAVGFAVVDLLENVEANKIPALAFCEVWFGVGVLVRADRPELNELVEKVIEFDRRCVEAFYWMEEVVKSIKSNEERFNCTLSN